MSEFKKEEKYLVLKLEDVDNLPWDTQEDLKSAVDLVNVSREVLGKKNNTYVVVNEDEPYARIVWKLIEFAETHTSDEVQRLLTNLTVELY